MDPKLKPNKFFIKGYDYIIWSKNEKGTTDKKEMTDKEEPTDKEAPVDLSDMPPLESDEEEVKEGNG